LHRHAILVTLYLKTSVLPVLVTLFLPVTHHRHALLAQLAFTAPLLLHRVLHVVLVQVLARLLLSQQHAVPATTSKITPAQPAALTPSLPVTHLRHAPLVRVALTATLSLHHAQRVVLVQVHALLLGRHHAIQVTLSPMTHVYLILPLKHQFRLSLHLPLKQALQHPPSQR
jgi:hypothetical protein